MNADGSGQKNLTKGSLGGGRPVLVAGRQTDRHSGRQSDSGDGLIYLMNADGSGVKRLGGEVSSLDLPTDLAENGGGLEWASDGRILICTAADDHGDVYAVDQDGSGSRNSRTVRSWGRSRCPRTARSSPCTTR